MKEFIVPVSDKGNVAFCCGSLKLPQLVRCKDCKHQYFVFKNGDVICGHIWHESERHNAEWFCADGEQKDGDSE